MQLEGMNTKWKRQYISPSDPVAFSRSVWHLTRNIADMRGNTAGLCRKSNFSQHDYVSSFLNPLAG
jgi:hypothetical protein